MQEINQEIGPMMFLRSIIMIMVMVLMEERIQEGELITCRNWSDPSFLT